MTREEAIQMFEPYLGNDCYTLKFQTACSMAIAALREQAADKNEPLTLDELGQMRDEPVWVQSPGVPEYGRWAIVAGVDTTDGDKTLYLHNDYTCHDYGRVWLAYRHKPKEEV